jgi:hypothetical protein
MNPSPAAARIPGLLVVLLAIYCAGSEATKP